LRKFSIVLGTVLLALVTSVQAVHLVCDVAPPPPDAPTAHDMALHPSSAPCMLCVRAHFGVQITTTARIAPAQFRSPASTRSENHLGSRLGVFNLYIRPPPSL